MLRRALCFLPSIALSVAACKGHPTASSAPSSAPALQGNDTPATSTASTASGAAPSEKACSASPSTDGGGPHAIGVLVGHGERRLDAFDLVSQPASGGQSSMASIISKQFPSAFRFVDVDLAHGDRAIDRTLDGLLVLQPSADLDDKELRRIDAFVMEGKSLVVAASAVNATHQADVFLAHLDAHRLDRLLAGYGITLNADVAVDFGKSFSVAAQGPNGKATIRFPQMPKPEGDAIDRSFPPFARVSELTLPFTSSVTVHPEAQPQAQVRVVASTSDRGGIEKGADVELSSLKHWKPPSKLGPSAVAAVAEGPLKSAFGSAASARPARVFVLASASAFANPFVAPSGTKPSEVEQQLEKPYASAALTSAILVLKATLDWMASAGDSAGCTPAPASSLGGGH